MGKQALERQAAQLKLQRCARALQAAGEIGAHGAQPRVSILRRVVCQRWGMAMLNENLVLMLKCAIGLQQHGACTHEQGADSGVDAGCNFSRLCYFFMEVAAAACPRWHGHDGGRYSGAALCCWTDCRGRSSGAYVNKSGLLPKTDRTGSLAKGGWRLAERGCCCSPNGTSKTASDKGCSRG